MISANARKADYVVEYLAKMLPGPNVTAYYAADESSRAWWYGAGAQDQGLSGPITADDPNLVRLSRGEIDGRRVLNSENPDRVAALDVTFTLPSTVSALWSQLEGEDRERVLEAFRSSVKRSLDYLAKEACGTRLDRDGTQSVAASPTIAAFEHLADRPDENGLPTPHLHIHALFFNAVKAPDGRVRTLDGAKLFNAQRVAGYLFNVEMTKRLRDIGIQTEKHKSWFEVKGPKSLYALAEAFSTRRKQALEHLAGIARRLAGKTGRSEKEMIDILQASSGARQHAMLATRNEKSASIFDANELEPKWKEMGREHGFSTREAQKLVGRVHRIDLFAFNRAFKLGLNDVIERRSHFTRQQLIAEVARHAQATGLSASEVISGVDARLKSRRHFVTLPTVDGEARFTTKKIWKHERKMFKKLEKLRGTNAHALSKDAVARALKRYPTIKAEQRRALEHVAYSKDSVSVVAGLAGVGKSFTLGAIAKAHQEAGYQVMGTALSGRAVKELTDVGIKSFTIAKLFGMDKRSKLDRIKGLFGGKPEGLYYRGDLNKVRGEKFTHKTLLIVDESSMIDSRNFDKIISTVTRARGNVKVLFAGDWRQLAPVDPGGPFRHVAKRFGVAELREVVRQELEVDRKVVVDLADGRTEEALKSLMDRGRVHVGSDRFDAMRRLIDKWNSKGGAIAPARHAIYASTNAEVRHLNRLAQEVRTAAKQLGPKVFELEGETFHLQDRVMFTRNDRRVGIVNGSTATLLKFDRLEGTITVRLDDSNKVVTVSLEDFEDALRVAYASTVHKAQGATVKGNAYVLAGGSMESQQRSYVALSRAKHESHLFVDVAEAGDRMKNLLKLMRRDQSKDVAHDVGFKEVSRSPNKAPHLPELDLSL